MAIWSNNNEDTSNPWSSSETKPKENEVRQFARSKAVNPQGGGQTNEDIQNRRETEKQKPVDTLSRTKEDVKSEEQTKDYQNTFLAEKSRELKQKLGGTADEIIARTQKFLNSGKTQVENLSSGSTFYNQETGKWEMGGDVAQSQSFKSLAQDKYNELQRLRESANVFFTKGEDGTWNPKEFRDVVAENYNQLTSDGKMKVDSDVNKLMSLAEKINRLDGLGQSNSAEAQGLRRQLELEDTSGVVSGLYEAKKSVEDLLSGNVSFYGDGGAESQTVGDILNLGLPEIEAELEKASASASGLFGGDYSAALARSLDKDSEEYANFMQEELNFKNTLGNAGQDYFKELQGNLTKMAREIQGSLKGIAPDLQQAMGEALGDYGGVAEAWFTALSDGDATDFVNAMQDLIFDPESGIMIQERAQLAKLVGDVLKKQGVDLGMDLEGDSLLSNAMYELEQTGEFSWINEDGKQITLKPNGAQKAQILYSAKQGADALKSTFKNMVNGTGMDVSKIVSQVLDSPSYRGMGMVVDSFKESVMDSMGTLKGSETEKSLISEVLGNDVALRQQYNNGELSEAEVNGLMLDYIKNNPKIAQDLLNSRWADRAKDFEAQSKGLTQDITAQSSIVNENLAKIANWETNIAEKQALVTDYPARILETMQQDIADNVALAEHAFTDGGYAQMLAIERGWTPESTQAKVNTASKGLGSIVALHSLRTQDPELFSTIIGKINAALKANPNMPGAAELADLELASMENSYRDKLMASLMTNNSGNTIATIIGQAMNSGLKEHPKLVTANQELASLLAKSNQAKQSNSEALARIEKQKITLGQMSKALNVDNIFSPRDIVTSASKIAQSLIDDGVAPVRQQGLDLGGTGNRDKVVAPMDALQQQAEYTPSEIQGQKFAPTDVSGKVDTIQGYSGPINISVNKNNISSLDEVITPEEVENRKQNGTWNITNQAGSGVIDTGGGKIPGYFAEVDGKRVFIADTTNMGRDAISQAIRDLGDWAEDTKSKNPSNVVDSIKNSLLGKLTGTADFIAPTGNRNEVELLNDMGDPKAKDYTPAERKQVIENARIDSEEVLKLMGYDDNQLSKMTKEELILRGDAYKKAIEEEMNTGNTGKGSLTEFANRNRESRGPDPRATNVRKKKKEDAEAKAEQKKKEDAYREYNESRDREQEKKDKEKTDAAIAEAKRNKGRFESILQ